MPENDSLSVLKLESLSFEEIHYSRDLLANGKPFEYEMNFNREISSADDNKHFKVSLIANIRTKEIDSVKVVVKLTGMFFCECEDEELKKELIQYNTVAIMFPYIRSQVSLVSTQPDIPPITIPAVNVVGLFKEVDQRENDSTHN